MAKPEKLEDLSKIIVARVIPDGKHPHLRTTFYAPYVMASTHPEYTPGYRFDWGKLNLALEQGYTVMIQPREERRRRKRK